MKKIIALLALLALGTLTACGDPNAKAAPVATTTTTVPTTTTTTTTTKPGPLKMDSAAFFDLFGPCDTSQDDKNVMMCTGTGEAVVYSKLWKKKDLKDMRETLGALNLVRGEDYSVVYRVGRHYLWVSGYFETRDQLSLYGAVKVI